MSAQPQRHEDDEENNRNSRSSSEKIGLAAAIVTVGLGVGAAMYYFFNKKRSEVTEHLNRYSPPQLYQPALDTSQPALGTNMNKYRSAFRERSWSLEECTICCEVMLKNQSPLMLPCGHKFHGDCVKKWLDEKGSCPNCRKPA